MTVRNRSPFFEESEKMEEEIANSLPIKAVSILVTVIILVGAIGALFLIQFNLRGEPEYEPAVYFIVAVCISTLLAQLGIARNYSFCIIPLILIQIGILVFFLLFVTQLVFVVYSEGRLLNHEAKIHMAMTMLVFAVAFLVQMCFLQTMRTAFHIVRKIQAHKEYVHRQNIIDLALLDMDDVIVFDRTDSLRGTHSVRQFSAGNERRYRNDFYNPCIV